MCIPVRDRFSGYLTAHGSRHLLECALESGTLASQATRDKVKDWLNYHAPFFMPTSKTIGDTVTCEQYDTSSDAKVCTSLELESCLDWNICTLCRQPEITCLVEMGHVPLAGRQGMTEGMCCSDAALPSKCMVGNSRR